MTNAWPQTCNYCGAPLIGGHRCPRCSYQRPKVDEIRYSGLTEVGGGGGGGVTPPAGIVRVAKGTNALLLGAPSINFDFGSYTFTQGSTVLVALMCPDVNGGVSPDITIGMTWGASTFTTPDGMTTPTVFYIGDHAAICVAYNVTGGTNNILLTTDFFVNEVDIIVTEVQGLLAAPFMEAGGNSVFPGDPPVTTSGLIGPTLTPLAGKQSFVWFISETDQGTNHGTYSANLTSGQQTGTQGVTPNFIREGYTITTATGPFLMSISGFDSTTGCWPFVALRGA